MGPDPGARWQTDPVGRHQLRYHDGRRFTGYVCDNGVVGVDGEVAAEDPVHPETGRAAPLASPPAYGSPTAIWPAWQQPPPFGADPQSPYGRAPWPGTTTPPPGRSRRVGLVIAVGAAVLEGIAIVVLSVALVAAHTTTSSQPIGSTVAPSGSFNQSIGPVVYSSAFGTDQHWPTGSLNANTTASLSNGQYLIQGWTRVHHLLITPYSVSHRAISVEAGVTDFSSDSVSMGVGCQSGSGVEPPLAYQLVVYPDGQWYIEEARIPGAVKTLASGYTSALGTTGTLQLTCVITATTAETETTQLVAYVNGSRVGAIGDQIARTFVGGYVPVLVVGSFGPRVHAAFNAMTVRSIKPPPVTTP